jgi:hypothetical protein
MTRKLTLAALLASSLSWAQDPAPAPAPTDAGRPRRVSDGGTAGKADGGAAPAASAGKADAGSADAGVAASKPRPAFALAKDSPTLEKWAKTKPEGRAALGLLKGVKIGERTFMGLFLENYELPASRKVDLSADVLILDCDKRIVLEKANAASTRTMDPKVHLAVPMLPTIELNYGNTDPDCVYSVKVTVFDLNRGVSWTTEGSFPVTR